MPSPKPVQRQLLAVLAVLVGLLLAGCSSLKWIVDPQAFQCQQLYEQFQYQTAFESCSEAANQGDSQSQAILGLLYRDGLGTQIDIKKARYWYRKAAASNVPLAMALMCFGYAYGEGDLVKEPSKAYELCTQADKQGDLNARYYLANLYFDGLGVAQNKEQANTLFRDLLPVFRSRANQGDSISQGRLGWMYLYGKGVAQSDTEAVRWYRKAAEQGESQAQNNLGWMYLNGKGVAQSDTEAVRWYRKAAEQGHAEAQNNLGWMYENGNGVAQSDTEAVRWYRKAAEQGDSQAQYNLGLSYLKGKGVSQSDTEAFAWFLKAAEQGDAKAQYELGRMYAKGKGVAQSDTEAVRWYRKAAEQGHAQAQFFLGLGYLKGKGVSQSDTEAVTWFRKAAEQGHAQAQSILGRMYAKGKGVPQSDTEAVVWYRKAAEQGHAKAQNSLGWMYLYGKGVAQSDTEAAVWYRKAAEQGFAKAQFTLGWMYEKGKGVSQSGTEAAVWYRKAAEQGDFQAQYYLGLMYKFGLGVTQSDTEAAAWFRKAEEPERRAVAKTERDTKFREGYTVTVGGVSFRLRGIPSGSFMMGSNNGRDMEKPVHLVSISSFYMMEHEVTFALWDACVSDGQCERPSDQGWGRGSRPVIYVSWDSITKQFIPWLNRKTGKIFRLPSESEWEYAARAGSTTKYSWGDSTDCSKARYGRRLSGECSNRQDGTVPVKSFSPNAFGLYDMHGNVIEWVQDCWNESYNGAPDNNRAWESGDCRRRVLRGGSWVNDPATVRSAFRHWFFTPARLKYSGFRLVQDL